MVVVATATNESGAKASGPGGANEAEDAREALLAPVRVVAACHQGKLVDSEGDPSGTVALTDRDGRETSLVTASSSASAFAGFRFPREVISVAVRWYLRYGLSYRDVEELLAERGVDVDHVTVCDAL
jgi:hypothetical protein